MNLNDYISVIPDFPKPGISFKDISPLLGDPVAFQIAIIKIAEKYKNSGVTKVVGLESRGFIFASAVAYCLSAGFVMCRKPGKLPTLFVSQSYEKEYGTDLLTMAFDAIDEDDKVLIVDDVLATGGTMLAAHKLVQTFEPTSIDCCALLEIKECKGKQLLIDQGVKIETIL